jgi:glycosyltransferase involved in cell wall biosynthesis
VSHVGALGGAEHSLLTLVTRLDPRAWEVHLALPDCDSALGKALVGARSVALHAVPELGVLRRDFPSVRRLLAGRRALRALVSRLEPDILHANSDIAMLYASACRGTRVVWHIRDMRRLGLVGGYLRSRSDARIAVSQSVATRYGLTLGPRDRVVANGIDLERFRPGRDRAEPRAELGIAADAIVCLAVGQDAPWKRLDDFVGLSGRGYTRVIVSYPPPGGAPPVERRSSEGLIALPYRDRIEDLYSLSDIYVHPARGEAFGRTVVEALASGLPVVCAAEGGPAEIVEHGVSGLHVAPGDTRALEDAVRRLVEDPELRARLALGARERARLYSAERHVEGIARVYVELLQ